MTYIKSLDEFKIRPDPIRDHRVSYPLASKKIDVAPVSRLVIFQIHFKFVGIEDMHNI